MLSPAQKKEILEQIASEAGGRLTPERVVEVASDVQHPLHGEFEWNDALAGHQHRLRQSRRLISSVYYVETIQHQVIKTVAYVRDPRAKGNEQGYVPIMRLKTESALAEEALVQEFERVLQILNRARNLARVLKMESAIDDLLVKIRSLLGVVSRPKGPGEDRLGL